MVPSGRYRLPATQNYLDILTSMIERCDVFVVFMTPNAAQSQAVFDEINYAREMKKPILQIELSKSQLPGRLKIILAALQHIKRYEESAPSYLQKVEASIPEACRQ